MKIQICVIHDHLCSARETIPLITFMSELTGNEAPSAPPRRPSDKPAIDPKDDPCVGDDADDYAREVRLRELLCFPGLSPTRTMHSLPWSHGDMLYVYLSCL